MACVTAAFTVPTAAAQRRLSRSPLERRYPIRRQRRHAASAATLRPLPQTVTEQVQQCAEVIALALSAEGGSHRRQRIEMLLPTNQR
jgi:hypothetical protein